MIVNVWLVIVRLLKSILTHCLLQCTIFYYLRLLGAWGARLCPSSWWPRGGRNSRSPRLKGSLTCRASQGLCEAPTSFQHGGRLDIFGSSSSCCCDHCIWSCGATAWHSCTCRLCGKCLGRRHDAIVRPCLGCIPFCSGETATVDGNNQWVTRQSAHAPIMSPDGGNLALAIVLCSTGFSAAFARGSCF